MDHLVLYITGGCNLACDYCFQKDQQYYKGIITEEIIDKSVDFLFNTSTSDSLSISFFGGEPLLAPEKIEYTCKYAIRWAEELKKQIKFSITTNLTLLTENVISMLKKYNVNVIASIDGMPKEGDVRYWKRSKITSCYVAFENLLAAQKAGLQIMIRWTISKNALTYIIDDFKKFIELGFYNLGMEFVYEETWWEQDLKDLENILYIIANRYIKKHREGVNIQLKPFEDGISLYKLNQRMNTRCGYGLHGMGIGADGDIQPCHRFVSRSDHAKWSFGNILTGIDLDKRQKMIDDWDPEKIEVADGRSCKECPVKLRCPGGSCFPVNLDTTGELYTSPTSYCDIQLVIQRVSNDILGILYGEQNEIIMQKLSGQCSCGPSNCQSCQECQLCFSIQHG